MREGTIEISQEDRRLFSNGPHSYISRLPTAHLVRGAWLFAGFARGVLESPRVLLIIARVGFREVR